MYALMFASPEVLFILDECNRATGALENKETETKLILSQALCSLFQSNPKCLLFGTVSDRKHAVLLSLTF
jgi:hypothetical protein